MQKGLIDEYKKDDIIGSLMINALQHTPPKDMFDDKEQALLDNNKNFKKRFEKNNFTKMDLYRGFASKIFWNYAHKNYAEYRTFIIENNIQAKKYNPNNPNYKDYKTHIELIKKSTIEVQINEIFNTIFKNETIKQIRTSKEEPKTLKIYDLIEIPTIKSIENFEQRFYELMTSEAVEPEVQESIQLMLIENNKDETLYDLCCKIRPIFY